MTRILLIGRNGQLGWELHRCLAPLGEVLPLDFPEIDLAQPGGVREIVASARPQVIVNAAAYTAVDRAESEPELAFAINARSAGILAEAAVECGAAFVHFSTDYVFDGTKGSAYVEGDPPNPLGVYGQSKLAGERAVQAAGGSYWIFRTSWVYSLRRDSFVTKVLAWARQNPTLRIVDDQVANPTWARLLAEVIAQLLAKAGDHPAGWVKERAGIYHLAGDGCASRLQWAQAILELDPRKEEQLAQALLPARTEDFPTPATRPLYSALDCSLFTRTFGLRLPPWQEALRLAMEEG